MHIVSENKTSIGTLENKFGISSKTEHAHILQPSNPIPK